MRRGRRPVAVALLGGRGRDGDGGTCLRDGLGSIKFIPSLEAVVWLSIRTSEYTSNALMNGGSCDVGSLRRVKFVLTLRKNRPSWYMLTTQLAALKLGNSRSFSL